MRRRCCRRLPSRETATLELRLRDARMPLGITDYVLLDWQSAGLPAESCLRTYVLTAHRSELTVIGISARAIGLP